MDNFIQAFSWINIRFLLNGIWITLLVSVLSILFSFVIGAVLGILRYMKIPVFSNILGFLIDTIRNLPLLLIIFFTYFGLPKMGVHLSVLWAAIFAMTIFESAMLSEVIRSGIQAVPKGQVEAARSTGLTYGQSMLLIILPQAFKKMVPAIVVQFVSLIKDTSLATVIMLPEFTYHAKIIYSQNSNYVLPMFLALTVGYFIICYALSALANYLSLRLAK